MDALRTPIVKMGFGGQTVVKEGVFFNSSIHKTKAYIYRYI